MDRADYTITAEGWWAEAETAAGARAAGETYFEDTEADGPVRVTFRDHEVGVGRRNEHGEIVWSKLQGETRF